MMIIKNISAIAVMATLSGFSASTSLAADCQDPPMPEGRSRMSALEETTQKTTPKGMVEVSTSFYKSDRGVMAGMPGKGTIRYHCKKEGKCYTNCEPTEVNNEGENNPQMKEKDKMIGDAQAAQKKPYSERTPEEQGAIVKFWKSWVGENGFIGM